MNIAQPAHYRYLAVLDAWRGLCALFVVMLHLEANSHFHSVSFFQNAWIFVDFFFVLSGFILSRNYEAKLAQGYPICTFLLLRLGRIYPLHIFMLLLMVAFEALPYVFPILEKFVGHSPFSTPEKNLFGLFTNLLLIHNLNIHTMTTWNGPSWSISAEFWCYIIFALTFAYINKPAIMMGVLAAAAAAFLLFYVGWLGAHLDFGVVRCMYGGACGYFGWKLWQRISTHPPQLQPWMWACVEIAAVVACVYYIAHYAYGQLSLLGPIVFMLFIVLFCYEKGVVSTLLKTKAFNKLGVLSFSIYMVHAFILSRLINATALFQYATGTNFYAPQQAGSTEKLFGRTLWEGNAFLALNIVCVLIFAYAAHKCVEIPCRAYFRTLSERFLLNKPYRYRV